MAAQLCSTLVTSWSLLVFLLSMGLFFLHSKYWGGHVLFSSGPSNSDWSHAPCIGRRGLPLKHQGCLTEPWDSLQRHSPVVVMQPVRSSRKGSPLAECFHQSVTEVYSSPEGCSGVRERRKSGRPLLRMEASQTRSSQSAGPAGIGFELRG